MNSDIFTATRKTGKILVNKMCTTNDDLNIRGRNILKVDYWNHI